MVESNCGGTQTSHGQGDRTGCIGSVQSCVPTSNADGPIVFLCACDQIRMRQQCSLPGCLGSCLLCCIPAPASPCTAYATHVPDCGSDTSTNMVTKLNMPCVHAVVEVLLWL